jgi:hypothetical protein
MDESTGLTTLIPHWFSARSELLLFLRVTLLQSFVDFDSAMASKKGIKTKIEDLLQKIEDEGLNSKTLDAIRGLQYDHWRIIWWGSFENLCVGDEPSAHAIRNLFHDNVIDFSSRRSKTIPPNQRDQFALFLVDLIND